MKNFKLLILTLSIITFFGCKETPPNPPEPKSSDNITLSFKVNSRYNNFETQWNDWQITGSGDTIKFDKVKYILSNFILVKQDGTQVPIPKSYAFVSLKDNINTFSFSEIPKGNYKSLIVTVGLDSATNHGNPQQYAANHPLNPSVNDMFWSWSGGYIFNVVEGNYKNNGINGGFSFHVATLANSRSYTMNYNFEITKNSKLYLDVNMERYFALNYSLKTDGAFSHSSPNDPIMTKFLNNGNGILSISAFE